VANIIDFEEPVKVNPYAADVQALIEAGEGKAGEVITKAGEENKARVLFAKAANEAGKTARLRVSEPGKDKGTTRLVFTLTEKHKARRGKAEADQTEQADLPVE
jgi:hypothetical protein